MGKPVWHRLAQTGSLHCNAPLLLAWIQITSVTFTVKYYRCYLRGVFTVVKALQFVYDDTLEVQLEAVLSWLQ